MKATVEYNLPDDRTDWEIHKMSWGMWHTLYHLDLALRNLVKHNPQNKSDEFLKGVEWARIQLNDLMVDNDVNLENVE